MPLSIGRVAAATGLSPKAIRLYEARGLIRSPQRTASGYRVYDEDDIAVLRFIRQARALGLDLGEVRRILDLQRAGGQPCATVLQLLDTRIREIDQTVSALEELRATLIRARESARNGRRDGDVVVCRLIESQPVAAPGPGDGHVRGGVGASRRSAS